MKVFISVDMEGASGVTDPEDVMPQGMEYQRCREFMTGDANAAIAGAFDAGAEFVQVNDSHWIMRNLLVDKLDRRARHIKGFSKPMCMVQGLDDSYDAAVFVGYHACAGTEGGVLDHTLLGKEVMNVYLNGEPMGETRINAAIAGQYGVPVALVAGDTAVCEEAKRVLGPDIETASVKEGIDKTTANLWHPEVAQERIRETTTRALRNLGGRKPYVLEPPITVAFDWGTTTTAANVAMIPEVKRSGPRTTEYTADSMTNVWRMAWVWCLLALQVGQKSGVEPGAIVYG
ncbi:MAG: M55 family metallopeptidase [Actinomycetota bacterium]